MRRNIPWHEPVEEVAFSSWVLMAQLSRLWTGCWPNQCIMAWCTPHITCSRDVRSGRTLDELLSGWETNTWLRRSSSPAWSAALLLVPCHSSPCMVQTLPARPSSTPTCLRHPAPPPGLSAPRSCSRHLHTCGPPRPSATHAWLLRPTGRARTTPRRAGDRVMMSGVHVKLVAPDGRKLAAALAPSTITAMRGTRAATLALHLSKGMKTHSQCQQPRALPRRHRPPPAAHLRRR